MRNSQKIETALRRRIIEISYRNGLSHLGSCLSAVDIIYAVYKAKKRNEKFILSSGHAAIALYVILEKYGLIKAASFNDFCIHPERDPGSGIDLSTGSLGHGLPIAVGMALADRVKNVYCLVSDGECAEGSIWEALRIAREQRVDNLKIVINANGWGAYDSICPDSLRGRLNGFGYKTPCVDGHDIKKLVRVLRKTAAQQPLMVFARTKSDQFPFLKGQHAHYHVMDEKDYKLAMDILR